jgi:hypothetical protein
MEEEMIRKNAKSEDIADILNHLDDADVLICAALRTKGLTKSGDMIGRNALDTLRRFVEALDEEACEKFSVQEWL